MLKNEIIRRAKEQGRKTLNEEEAKQVLKEYGVPVVMEHSVGTIDELEQSADKIDYPVALKGLGSRLTHKTERGLVKLNLKNKSELLSAAQFIKTAAGNDLEGFLIQPMIEGKREFVVGLFRDKQFGPTVMFGVGGVFTEAIGDTVFRIAPLDEKEAERMIDELHSQKLLGAFRGENAADKNALIKTLIGLSRIGLELEDVKEIDINPLVVSSDGRITAVDALIVLGEKEENQSQHNPVDAQAIGNLFYPKSIAFIGASAEFGKWGHLLFTNVIGGKYEGDIFLVNPKGGEIAVQKGI